MLNSRKTRAVLVGALLVLAAALLTPRARASGDPNLEWWTIETTHFRVHYPRHLEPSAARIAALAETIHGRLTVALGYVPKSATEIVLTDDTDAANGSAIAIPINTIRLFITAPDDMSPLGDYDDWYLDLVTHEYTHILHTDNVSGIPAVVNAILGKTIIPNRLQPNWVLEGLAVLEESEHSSAGRIRGTMYEMFLRTDVLEDNIASLDQVSNISYRWPQRTLWYLYGSRFLRWICDVYGTNTMRTIAADYGAQLIPGGINRSIRRATGKTYVELYEGFKDYWRRRVADQMRVVEKRGIRQGVRITHHGREVGYPRFVPPIARSVPGREEIVFFRDDTDERDGIYRLALGDPRSDAHRDEELVARAGGTPSPAFTPGGDLVFSATAPFKNVYSYGDLFMIPRGRTAPTGDEPWRRRLTTAMRASGVDVSPDGRHVAFSANAGGTSYLDIAELAQDGSLRGTRALVESARFEQAFTPRFSPDGKQLAYSAWTAGGYRDIRIVDVATGAFRRITADRAVDMQPIWSPDGKTLYFCSDRTGISNVYALDLASGKLAQVTNVRTGAYQPAVSPDGGTLVYVGYTHEGFDLYAMKLDRAQFLEALPPPADRPDPPAEPSGVELRRHRYNPLPTLAPRVWSFEYKPGSYGGNALTINGVGSDVVGHHSIAASIIADTDAPGPNVTLDYAYGRLPFDLSARFFHTVSPRGGYRINDKDTPFNESTNGITAGISYPIIQEFGSHGVGLSYSVAHFSGDLPVGRRLDPYATVTVQPASGVLGVVHVGYGFSTVEGSADAAGPVRGVSASIGVDYADTSTVSDYSLRAFQYSLSGYVQMPWPGHHTVALRTSGAVSAGTYPRGGLYFVGGYDLENNNLIDTVTTGVFNGAFVLRGYEPRTYFGREYVLETAEYRFPIYVLDHGLSTLPIFLRRIDGNLFTDYGGAFDHLDLHAIELFHDGYLIDTPQLHASVGGELWFGITLGYGVNVQLRLGYAYGFSEKAISGGQKYFVAAGAF